MNKQHSMRNILIILLSAVLMLCTAVLTATALSGSFNAYAADAAPTDAPLAYEFTAETEEAEAYYTVTGVNTAEVAVLDATKKTNLKVTIPAVYNDQANGQAPVKVIGDKAFSESTLATYKNNDNTGLAFVEVDLSNAVNLETIGMGAFVEITSTQRLTLPINVKKIKSNAFVYSNFSGIVFNDELEYVELYAFTYMPNISGTINITPKLQFVNSGGSATQINVFYNSKIEAFTVDAENQHYKAEDGVLFSKDGKVLIAYPGGKVAEMYRVPTTVTVLAARCFQGIDCISTIILPTTLENVDSYAFSNCTSNIYLNSDPTTTNWGTTCLQGMKGNVICDTAADKEILWSKYAFYQHVAAENLLSLNDISVFFDAGSDTIYNNTTVEQLKQYFTVTGNADKGITIPLDAFTLVLPENGLVIGTNKITVKYSNFSKDIDIQAEKGTPAAPAAPTVSGTPTENSITLTAIEGAEYSCNGGNTWQESPTFTGLEANTEYTFIVRIKATDTNYESEASATATIKTDKVTPAAPAAPTVSGTPTANSITLTAIEGAEYSCNGGTTWQESPTFTGLEANTEYTFIVRIKATDTNYASEASVLLTVKTDKGGLSGGAIAGIVIGSVLVASILALLSLFIFRKDKSLGFKEYYVELGGKCKGKINGLFRKEKAENPAGMLYEEGEADQAPAAESDDEDE